MLPMLLAAVVDEDDDQYISENPFCKHRIIHSWTHRTMPNIDIQIHRRMYWGNGSIIFSWNPDSCLCVCVSANPIYISVKSLLHFVETNQTTACHLASKPQKKYLRQLLCAVEGKPSDLFKYGMDRSILDSPNKFIRIIGNDVL